MEHTTRANSRAERLQSGIAKLRQEGFVRHQIDYDTKTKGNYYMFRHGVSGKPLFSWADHPTLITDAVENGWSRFAFTGYLSSSASSARSSTRLLGMCAAGDPRRESEPETSWEICQDSADFMQKIRLNPGRRKALNVESQSMAAMSVIRTALPLPGPPLGNSSFPQEAYFEITVLYCRGGGGGGGGGEEHDSISNKNNNKGREGEKTKLIQENSNARASSESLVHFNGSHRVNKIEDLKLGGKLDDGKDHEGVMLSVGLTAGGSLPLKLPGSYPGSIGFNSDGSVYVDGNS